MLTLASPMLLADSDHWHGPGWWVVFPRLLAAVLRRLVLFFAFGRPSGLPWGRRLAGESRLAERLLPARSVSRSTASASPC